MISFIFKETSTQEKRQWDKSSTKKQVFSDSSNRNNKILTFPIVAAAMRVVGTFTAEKKGSFPLRISSVNVSKSVGHCGFGHIYWRNPSWETSFFVQRVVPTVGTINCLQYQYQKYQDNVHLRVTITSVIPLWMLKIPMMMIPVA